MPGSDPFTTPFFIIVDGLEGRLARVELPDGTTEDWPLASLPRGVQEGSVVRVKVTEGDLEVEVDYGATQARREQAQRTLIALNAAGPSGEIEL